MFIIWILVGAVAATAVFTYRPELAIRAGGALRAGVRWFKATFVQ